LGCTFVKFFAVASGYGCPVRTASGRAGKFALPRLKIREKSICQKTLDSLGKNNA
jgi:hypothetical protein